MSVKVFRSSWGICLHGKFLYSYMNLCNRCYVRYWLASTYLCSVRSPTQCPFLYPWSLWLLDHSQKEHQMLSEKRDERCLETDKKIQEFSQMFWKIYHHHLVPNQWLLSGQRRLWNPFRRISGSQTCVFPFESNLRNMKLRYWKPEVGAVNNDKRFLWLKQIKRRITATDLINPLLRSQIDWATTFCTFKRHRTGYSCSR